MYLSTKPLNSSGFSLVELSIVLVILGLLTGGILTGQSLIRAAELRAITTEVQQYQTAVNTFKQKYFALPGDMPNATRFWGDNDSECADAAITNGSPGTCNGNGDGVIEETSSGGGDAGEAFMFWNQLAYAALIEGQYSGESGGSDDGVLFNQNAPASKISSTGYQIIERDWSAATTNFRYNHTNSLLFGAQNLPSSDWVGNPTLVPEEAWNIDKKIDDGLSGSGKVISVRSDNNCTDAANSTDYTAAYTLSATAKECALVFRNMF